MDRQGSSGLTSLGFGVLAFNSVLAIYSSWGDASSVGFVLLAVAALMLLFICLHEFEQGGASRRRETRIKTAVWALTTLLTVMLASRVAPLMPPLVGVFVWAMAVATAAGGLWAFFQNP